MNMLRIIASIFVASLVPLTWWVGGYDFDERGLAGVACFVLTGLVGFVIYVSPAGRGK